MPSTPSKPQQPRRMRRLYITVDDATESRLLRIQERHAGLKSLSAAVRHSAQVTDDAESKNRPNP